MGCPLQKRKERLEREIARSGARDKSGAKTLTKSQEQLLQVLFQIDCLQVKRTAATDARPPSPPAAAPRPTPDPAARMAPTRALPRPGFAGERTADKKLVETTGCWTTCRSCRSASSTSLPTAWAAAYASTAVMAARAFGHSYLTDSAAVLRDIQSLLRKRLPARQRGLAETGISPNVYWSLR